LTLDAVDDLAGHVAAEANHCPEARVRRVLDAVYDRLANIEDMFTNEDDEAAHAITHDSKLFTPKQGQYLAFIYYYTKIHRKPPAEADCQRFFRVTPPVVHQMIKTVAARGFIDREPRTARSIRLRLTRAQLPDLD
jgi:repressor LexA